MRQLTHLLIKVSFKLRSLKKFIVSRITEAANVLKKLKKNIHTFTTGEITQITYIVSIYNEYFI